MTNLMTTHTSSSSSSYYSSPSRRFSLAGSLSLAGYNIPEMGESGIEFPPQRPTAAISPTNTLQGTDSSGDSSAFSGDNNVAPVSPVAGVTMRHGDARGRNPFVRSVPSPRSSQIYQETMFTSEVRTMSVSSLHSEAPTVETVASQRRSQRRSNQFVTAVSHPKI